MERQKVIEAEVKKLLVAKFIEEIEYLDWLSSVVVVKKSNNKWRMCVDYTDLNKAWPKDHYPLRSIDHLIDATTGYHVLSFLDAFFLPSSNCYEQGRHSQNRVHHTK